MTTTVPEPLKPTRTLARFVGQIVGCDGTPSIIMTVGANAEYLKLCRAIAAPDVSNDPVFAGRLKTICHAYGIDPIQLKERLAPAARALGLLFGDDGDSDFYDVLDVDPHATGNEIREAFRHKALKFHPDTQTDPTAGGQAFIQLNDAYQTLRDPCLRHHYDAVRRQARRWREPPGGLTKEGRPTMVFVVLGGLFLIFILLILATEMMVESPL